MPWCATGGGAFSGSVTATCCASCSMLKGFKITWPILAHADGFKGVDGVQYDIPYGLKGSLHPWADG